MTKLYSYAGSAASLILIAFGAGSIAMGVDGRDRVRDDLAREMIVGTEDSAIAGQKVDTGREAQVFATVIREHTLESTDGLTYAQMGRFLDENGNPTSDESAAAKDPKTGAPVENGLRQLWVTSTALSTALNTAYFAERVATLAIRLSGSRRFLTNSAGPRAAPPCAPASSRFAPRGRAFASTCRRKTRSRTATDAWRRTFRTAGSSAPGPPPRCSPTWTRTASPEARGLRRARGGDGGRARRHPRLPRGEVGTVT